MEEHMCPMINKSITNDDGKTITTNDGRTKPTDDCKAMTANDCGTITIDVGKRTPTDEGQNTIMKDQLNELRNTWLMIFAVTNTIWLALIFTLANKGQLFSVLGSNPAVKQAHQFCAKLRAAEHVDGKVEGGVEVADQNGNIVKELNVLGIVIGHVRIN
ncbi:hypothetical protein DPMN_145652 [Dreissena polymorpha]|uniref:Uncharacterized protein n=1 Tax=Dreissena polymorpha TaxID=45954 RepID=A0A9D4F8V3_DREPO|nr:hypothetical protein DPMN_145652 [Dreissena polymorpha]